MAKEFIEISEEEYLGGGKDFIEVSEEEFNTPLPKIESATNTMEVTARELETGVARAGLGFAQGIAGGVRGFTDLFGADNAVSKKIAGYEKDMDQLITAEAKKDTEEVTRLFKEVEGKGILPQVVAGFEAFKTMPTETISGAAGYMIPNIALGLVGKAAQLGRAGMIGLQAGAGAAQGAGIMKGQIYSAVKDELRQQGVAEDKVDEIASKAQAYGGKNLDQILLGAGLNALAASTGAEAILTRVLSGTGKASSGVIKGVLKGGLAEAPVEFIQGGQEQVAQNLALQREGVDVPTMQGVIPAATMEATAGLLIGGAAGGIESLSPEQKAEIEITKEANRKARDLEAPDTATQAIAAAITNLERGIDNKRKDLDVLESTSPEAAKLRLDIAADQKILAQSKEQANKLGLSETITEAEKQQIELAKAIITPEAAPAAPTVKESLTVQPTPSTPVAEVPAAAPVEQVVTPPVVEGLQAVSENTATPEQLTQLSESGLVDIVKGQPIINEEGQAVLTEAQAPLPVLTPEERRAEIEAAPAPVTEQTAPAEAPAPEAAPTLWVAPEQKLTSQENRALQIANLRGTEKRTGNITFVPEKMMTPQRLQSLRTEQESSGTLKQFPRGGKFIEIKMMADVTGDPNAKGWAIIDRRTDLNRREWIAQIPNRDERILAGSIANNESQKIVSAIKEGSITQERSNQLVDEAVNNQIISSDFANNLKTEISKSTPAVSETITKPKLGEKGGVLIPTKEDFIQAGQNIYEKGMEFGAWAKQMIQQFGDAV